MAASDIMQRLDAVIAERKSASPESSYVAQLHDAGLNRILEKVEEEAIETIVAAREHGGDGDGDAARTERVVEETADLWFHTVVMLGHLGLSTSDVLEELEKRFGTSGISEKAARGSR